MDEKKKHGQERDAVADIKKDEQKIGRELEKERGTRERKKLPLNRKTTF